MISALEWKNIDTVLLDMDGTLLDLHFDNHFWLQHMPQRLSEARGISVEQALQLVNPIFRAEYGKLHWYSIDFWAEQTKLDIESLKREVKHLIQYRPKAQAFLKALRLHRKEVLLVTNADRRSVAIKVAETGLDEYLDAIHCSHDFGAAKEDPKFWPLFEQHTGIDKSRSVFIDDTTSVLDAAHNYGIQHVLAIEQPDSKNSRVLETQHRRVTDFDEITPQ
ncbi:MAG: GMP/IMP nucleotidase [Pseudomonadales bacterium]